MADLEDKIKSDRFTKEFIKQLSGNALSVAHFQVRFSFLPLDLEFNCRTHTYKAVSTCWQRSLAYDYTKMKEMWGNCLVRSWLSTVYTFPEMVTNSHVFLWDLKYKILWEIAINVLSMHHIFIATVKLQGHFDSCCGPRAFDLPLKNFDQIRKKLCTKNQSHEYQFSKINQA